MAEEQERHDSDPEPGAEKRVDEDPQDLVAGIERERDEYLDLARRTKADFENYRKRVASEARTAERRGQAALAGELLPVLDNLERALAAAEPHDREVAPNHLAEGVRLVREELAAVLARCGVEGFEPDGEPFDPNEHEAVMTRPVDGDGAGMVLEVVEKGYRLDGQVLRPARVVVGSENRPSGAKAPENRPSAGKPADGFAEG